MYNNNNNNVHTKLCVGARRRVEVGLNSSPQAVRVVDEQQSAWAAQQDAGTLKKLAYPSGDHVETMVTSLLGINQLYIYMYKDGNYIILKQWYYNVVTRIEKWIILSLWAITKDQMSNL